MRKVIVSLMFFGLTSFMASCKLQNVYNDNSSTDTISVVYESTDTSMNNKQSEKQTKNTGSIDTFVKNVTSKLNVRSRPKHDSALLYTITDCDTILHTCFHETAEGMGSNGKMHEWEKVLVSPGILGWVRSDLVKEK